MSEEPRRSRRDNKGVNIKNAEDSLAPPKPKSNKSKPTRQSVKQEDEDTSADIVRCVCGSADDDGRMFIQCDNCLAWQHNDCIGVTMVQDEVPEHYRCEKCDPAGHKALLVTLQRGEKPWEERAKHGEKRGQKKVRRAKSARQSAAEEPNSLDAEQAPIAKETAASSLREGNKRKFSAAEGGVDQQSAKMRRASRPDRQVSESSSEPKAVQAATSPKALPNRSAVLPTGPDARAASIADMPNPNRKGVATFIRAKFDAQIVQLSQARSYRVPPGQTAESMAESLALAVEDAMFQYHCDPLKPDYAGPYKLQMTEIASNIMRNDKLMIRLLDGSITTGQLAKMPSEEMASEELQREMASMKEEADKQATLIQEPGRPTMRRTHKGDEYIEDPSAHIGASFAASAAPVPRRRESGLGGPQTPTLGQEGQLDEDEDHLTESDGPAAPARRATTGFDIKNVWQSVQSPDSDQQPRVRPHASHISAQGKITNGDTDAEIDRLLDEDDNESVPYSPSEISGDSSSVPWRGKIDMPNVGKFKAFAQHVAGSDLSSRLPMHNIFPHSLLLSGRIDHLKADKYLCSLGAARSTDVVVHRMLPARGADEAESEVQFRKLFDYFVDRKRWGVVSDTVHREFVTDNYIVPVKAGAGEAPDFLSRLDHNKVQGLRQESMLLAVFVLKWRSQMAVLPDPAASAASGNDSFTPPAPQGSSGTPIDRTHFMSPVNAQLDSESADASSSRFPTNGADHDSASTRRPPDIRTILGDFWHCSTAQDVLRGSDSISEEQLNNLRRVLESNPLARTDMGMLAQILGQSA